MKNRSAFSLIELSIVIIVIGILIAGVTKGLTMIKKSRLSAAASLTKSSPVSGISDLMLWYETTSESSFDETVRNDGDSIATWYDLNPQSSVKNNATQTTSSYQPLFKTEAFNNGIPAVRFDGSNDYLSFNGGDLVGNNYTVFVVEQKRAAVTSSVFSPLIGGTDSETATNFSLAYVGDSTVRLTNFNITLTYTSSADLSYSSPKARLHSGIFSTSKGMEYWLNSISKSSNSSLTTALISFNGAAIGRRLATFFNGDIAEVIIFSRALSDEEKQSIETYLGKKFAISLT